MKSKYALISIFTLIFITFCISGFTFFTAVKNFNLNGNVFDFCSGAIEYIPYFMIFLLILFMVLPIALFLFKEKNISIKDAIYDKRFLSKDILSGIILGVISSIIVIPFSLMRENFSVFDHELIYNNCISFSILYFLSLSIVCGIFKELYFRGFAKFFLSDVFGENLSYVITSLLFCIVDWHNMGSSFVLGILWGFAYKKNGRLIVPMIAHGLINAIGLVYLFIV